MLGDNYNVRIHYKKIEDDIDRERIPELRSSRTACTWRSSTSRRNTPRRATSYEPSAGKVLEYYRPKSEFAGKVKAQVLHFDDTKKLQFEFEDGSIVEGFINPGKNKFIEDEPYAKSYNEGQKRWWIEKSDGSKVYDKRKSVGQPKESTGEYSDSEIEDAMRGQSAAKNPFGMDMKKPDIIRETQSSTAALAPVTSIRPIGKEACGSDGISALRTFRRTAWTSQSTSVVGHRSRSLVA